MHDNTQYIYIERIFVILNKNIFNYYSIISIENWLLVKFISLDNTKKNLSAIANLYIIIYIIYIVFNCKERKKRKITIEFHVNIFFTSFCQ